MGDVLTIIFYKKRTCLNSLSKTGINGFIFTFIHYFNFEDIGETTAKYFSEIVS